MRVPFAFNPAKPFLHLRQSTSRRRSFYGGDGIAGVEVRKFRMETLLTISARASRAAVQFIRCTFVFVFSVPTGNRKAALAASNDDAMR